MLYLTKIFLTIISRLLPQMDFLTNSFVKSLKTPILSSLSFSSSKGLSSFSLLRSSDVLYFSYCSFLSELNDLLGLQPINFDLGLNILKVLTLYSACLNLQLTVHPQRTTGYLKKMASAFPCTLLISDKN